MNLQKNYLIKHLIDTNINGIAEVIPNDDLRQYFSSMYIFNLNNYKAYGYFEQDKLKAIISCYKSIHDASWYLTHVFYSDIDVVPELLSYCINLYENEGVYKFYNLVPADSTDRDLYWKPNDKARYIQVDECKLPEKTKSFYGHYNFILLERTLHNIDYIVRCNFLKSEYRTEIPLGGNI
jgi:hypothetical protein